MLIDLDKIEIPFQIDAATLDTLHFKAYHCMRGFSDDIKLQGLKCLHFEEHMDYIRYRLMQYGVSSVLIGEYFCAVKKEFTERRLAARENQICFCLNQALFKTGNGCRDFFKYFGGEVVYRVAKYSDAYPEIKIALENIGTPLLVTSKICLKAAGESQRHKVQQYLVGNLTGGCEVFIKESVNPRDILDIKMY